MDILERLRRSVTKGFEPTDEDAIDAANEIERLRQREAYAIREERERCAKIAETAYAKDPDYFRNQGLIELGTAIARAIREQ